MKYHPVGRAIGNANNEGPDLIAAIDPDAEDDAPPGKSRKAPRPVAASSTCFDLKMPLP